MYSIETKEIGCGWNNDSGFRHRLVFTDKSGGKKYTEWATYQDVTLLDGFCGVTPYYTDYGDIMVLTINEAAKYVFIS